MHSGDRVAVVTGGGKGIGRAIVGRLFQANVAVSVWDRNEDVARTAAEEIVASGGRAIACVGDASDPDNIQEFCARTRKELGRIGILVNNAGSARFSRFEDITAMELEELLVANFKGPFFCTKAVLPDMLEQGWGRIINVTSSSAQTGAPMMSHYIASKSALSGLTKALATEYAESGITVNNVSPGFIDTPMLRRGPYDIDTVSAYLPMKKVGQPDEIAAACAYLIGDDAGYVTGQTINVNGGRYFGS